MKTSTRMLVVLLLAVLVTPAAFAAKKRKTGGTVAFVNVRVVSMNPEARKRVQKRQTVIVEKGRITKIGKVKAVEIPEGATVVNGRNKLHVLPGLVDMHTHSIGIPDLPESVGPKDIYTVYFANGVTTTFDLYGFKLLFKWRKAINRGKIVGPSLYFTSPILDEEDYDSLADLEAEVRTFHGQGYDYIKSHTMTTKAAFDRVNDIARELSVPVVGHALRPGFPIQDTLAQKPLMIAHIEEILSTSVDDPARFETQLETPLMDVANSRVWVTGTVVTYENIAAIRDSATFAAHLNRPEMRYLPPSIRQAWELDNRYLQADFGGSRDFWLSQLDIKLYIARRLKELGALDRLLLGTDAGVDMIIHGFSLHDELRLLVEAGLSPWEAILTGTYNPAVFFGVAEEAGTVEEGKRADLLVVKKNPLKQVERLADPAGVMVNGVWLPEEVLEERLEELAARWEE